MVQLQMQQHIARYFIDTWGCQMNAHDSEKIAGSLRNLGYLPAATEEEADLIVLNTFSLREKAEEKVFCHLGRLKELKESKSGILGGAGGVARRGRGAGERGKKGVETGRDPENLDFPPERIDRIPGVKAFITIMEGCDNFCSFCIVPFTRGRERCRPLQDIVAEAELMARQGVKEIQLLGQNVNSYRDPRQGKSFAELLDAVHEVEGIQRIRFTSPHPKDFDRPSMERFRDLPKLCPHMHLPAQSCSTVVLARMKRGHSREEYLEKVEGVRRLVPDIALSTDLIVGFPGENDEEFEDTLRLVQAVGFDDIFSFKYSPRPYTSGLRELPDDISADLKSERLAHLMEMQRRIQLRKNQDHVGRT